MTSQAIENVSDEAALVFSKVPTLEAIPEDVESSPEPLPDIHVVLGRQQNQYFSAPKWPTEQDQTLPIAWILRHDGMWQRRINDVGIFTAHVSKFNVPGFPKEENAEGFVLRHGLIPHELLDDIISFFKMICDDSRDEVYMQIFWGLDPENPEIEDEHFFCYCPTQIVSGASVDFIRNEKLEESATLVFEIHSHNTMMAYFSEVDNRDEKSDRLFAVVGKLDTARPEKKFSYVCGGKRVEVPEGEIFTKPLGNPNFPGWLKNITRRGAVATTSQGWPSGSSQNGYNPYSPHQPGTWKTQTGQTQTQTQESGIRPSHIGATSGPIASAGGRSLWENEEYGNGYNRGSAVVQKRASTVEEIRSQVKEAASSAATSLESMMTLKSRDFIKDATMVPGFKKDPDVPKIVPSPIQLTPTTGEPEVSRSNPFFRQGKATAVADASNDAEDYLTTWVEQQQAEAWDAALQQKITEICNAFANQTFIEEEMTDDQKMKMFESLMAHLENKDIELLSKTMVACGYDEFMQQALLIEDFDDKDDANSSSTSESME